MKRTAIDVLPSPAYIQHNLVGRDQFKEQLRQGLAELMAERDALVFEPFFRSREMSYEIKRLQTVPEQQKFSIGYERYGCMICEASDRPHAGNGLCARCHSKWFRRYAEIIKEGMEREPAKRGRGATREERLLPENRVANAPHRTYYERSSREELKTFAEIADQTGVSPDHVREVARGGNVSGKVAAALDEKGVALHPRARASANLEKRRTRELYARVAARLGVTIQHVQRVIRGGNTSSDVVAVLAEEGVRVPDSGKPPRGFHPNTLAGLARSAEKQRNRTAADRGDR
jgi:hypothetical protein